MRNDKIIPGVILVMIGGVILLHNYGHFDFYWSNLFYLLPIIIIIGGINLLFGRRSGWATALKLLVLIAGFGLLIFGNFGHHNDTWLPYSYQYNDSDNDNYSNDKGIVKIEGNSVFNEPYTVGTKTARLNISGGGTIYNLGDTTNQLFNASTKEFSGKYNFSHSVDDSVYVLNFNMQHNHGNHFSWHDHDKTNSATFKLNMAPEWEINVETGATKLNFDLSKFKIRSLKLSGGAASFDVRLGRPLAVTNVNVETGVSEVNISIPSSAACRITKDSGLSSNNFEGFNKKGDDRYETENFGTAQNRFYIKLSGGVSDFKVKRY